MTLDPAAARRFIHTNGRVLDRRLYAAAFEGAPGEGVVATLLAYRNDDGGFGHGLEADKRVPSSTPLDTETAFQAMDIAGSVDGSVVRQACDWLASVADGTGLLPLVFDDMLEYPHAAHWDEIPRIPDINPTAGIAALLWKWDIDHPWRDAASAGCWKIVDDGIPKEIHSVREILRFLEQQPDRTRAVAVLPRIGERLGDVTLFHATPGSSEYGLTPLDLAPSPASISRPLFADHVYERFLDELEAQQQDDGGWPISWEPPGPAAVFEWRSWVTILTLETLAAWGRLPA